MMLQQCAKSEHVAVS